MPPTLKNLPERFGAAVPLVLVLGGCWAGWRGLLLACLPSSPEHCQWNFLAPDGFGVSEFHSLLKFSRPQAFPLWGHVAREGNGCVRGAQCLYTQVLACWGCQVVPGVALPPLPVCCRLNARFILVFKVSSMRSTWGVVTSNIRVVKTEGLNICWVKCIPIHQPFAPGSTDWSVSVKSPVRSRLWEAYFSHPRIFMVLPCLSSVKENSCFLSCWLGRRAWVTLVLKLYLLWSTEASVMTLSFKVSAVSSVVLQVLCSCV